MGNKNWFEKKLIEFERDFDFRLDKHILDFTEQICSLLNSGNVSRSELAKRLGKNKSYLTRVLNGNTNLTFKTMLEFAEAAGGDLKVHVRPQRSGQSVP